MFGLGKPKEDVSNRSKEILKNAIQSTNVDTNDYTIVYGYFMKNGLMSKKMYNYAIGLSKDTSNMIIVQIGKNGSIGEIMHIETADIQNAKVNMQGIVVIKSNQGDIKFTVPPYTGSNAERTYQLPIVQEEESDIIRSFIKSI
ncbi:MAG: hypothetical protein ACK5LC_02640 [Coprobacillaceae bacterium]